jgi:hypothetical protein
MERGRARGIMRLGKYFLHIELLIVGEPRLMPLVRYSQPIKLWIAGEPGLMPLVKYFLHIELWIVGESEACYLWQGLYRSSHETGEGRSYTIPDTLQLPYLLLLFIVVLFLDLLLVHFFVLFVLVNTGKSVSVVFL